MAELIEVQGGDILSPGQIGICEDHPDHPLQTIGTKGEPDYQEFHQALIVKDDPKYASGEVAMTSMVAYKLQTGELKYGKAVTKGGAPVDPALDGGQDATARANTKAIEKAEDEPTQAEKNNAEAMKADQKAAEQATKAADKK